jgi:hypothetical protein
MKLIVSVFFFLHVSMIYAQGGSFTIYAGSSYAWSTDKVMTPEGTSHTGFVVGGNLRMLDDGMCFLFTAEYGRFNLMAREKVDFTYINKDLHYTKGKFGIGKNLFKVKNKLKFQTKLQGNILYIQKFDPNLPELTPAMRETGYYKLNEAIGGLSTGLGINYKFIDLDFEYEHGFFNIYNNMKSTNMNFISWTLGIRL